MPIAREGSFLRWADAPHLPSLGIESVNLPECVAQIKALGLKGVFGSPAFGFEEENLDFLNAIPSIESVWFWDVALKNIDGLYALENLRHFGVHPKRPPLQLDRFPHLQTAVVTPRAKDSGLERLGELHTLHLWHFKDKDYAGLALPDSLVELKLLWASPSSLEQLQALPTCAACISNVAETSKAWESLARNILSSTICWCRLADGSQQVTARVRLRA